MNEINEDILKAEAEYNAALNVIRRASSDGCPGSAGRGHEARYGQAHQRLVQLGAAPQVRRKYRG
jgi:hypothetical protein